MNKLQWRLHYREQRISSKEEWKPVPGYEGLYEVSSFGRVRSMNYKRLRIIKILTPSIRRSYQSVTLCKEGIHYYYWIHRLVGLVFIKNKYNHRFINHINGIKLDNRSSNLEWCTHTHNVREAFRLGLNKSSSKNFFKNHNPKPALGKLGKLNWSSKSIVSIDKQGNTKIYSGMLDAARITGVHNSGISAVCLGKRKTAGGLMWKFYLNK